MEGSFKEFNDELMNLIEIRDRKLTTNTVEETETIDEKVVEKTETTNNESVKEKAVETKKKKRVRTKKSRTIR